MNDWSIEELAMAYELRCEGCSWKCIARGLGGDWKILQGRVRNLVKDGIYPAKLVVRNEALDLAHAMRTTSRLSWNAIARYLGHTGTSLRAAYSRRVTRGHYEPHN